MAEEQNETQAPEETKKEKASENHPEMQKLIDLLDKVVPDANDAFKNKNKSAARRARVGLMEVKKLITPLRNAILESVKSK